MLKKYLIVLYYIYIARLDIMLYLSGVKITDSYHFILNILCDTLCKLVNNNIVDNDAY